MDREADFYELFDEQRSRRVELLVRAKHDRATAEELKLFEFVRHGPVQSQLQLHVPRQSSRAKKSKQKVRVGHQQRTARVELRWREVEFLAPSKRPGKKALRLRVVHVLETSPPPDAQPVEWLLLTTCEITTTEQAQECLRWYCLRWRIEDWHRILKSGCRIEALQHKTAERLNQPGALQSLSPRSGFDLQLVELVCATGASAHSTRSHHVTPFVAGRGGTLDRACWSIPTFTDFDPHSRRSDQDDGGQCAQGLGYYSCNCTTVDQARTVDGPCALHRRKNLRRQTNKLRSASADAVKLFATTHPGNGVTEEFRIIPACHDQRVVKRQRHDAQSELDAAGALGGGVEDLGRGDGLVAARMVLAYPCLVVAEPVDPLYQFHVALHQPGRVFIHGMMGREKNAVTQFASTYEISLQGVV